MGSEVISEKSNVNHWSYFLSILFGTSFICLWFIDSVTLTHIYISHAYVSYCVFLHITFSKHSRFLLQHAWLTCSLLVSLCVALTQLNVCWHHNHIPFDERKLSEQKWIFNYKPLPLIKRIPWTFVSFFFGKLEKLHDILWRHTSSKIGSEFPCRFMFIWQDSHPCCETFRCFMRVLHWIPLCLTWLIT
jgi:hypothetical protein